LENLNFGEPKLVCLYARQLGKGSSCEKPEIGPILNKKAPFFGLIVLSIFKFR
jgi:hypothetical protein